MAQVISFEALFFENWNVSHEEEKLEQGDKKTDGWRTNIWGKELDLFSKVPNTNVAVE